MAENTDDRSFIYRIDTTNRICFVNRDWLDFAQENEAPDLTREAVLGQPLDRFINDWETRHLYEILYQRVRKTGKEIVLPFRCDSPSYRRFMELSIRLLKRGKLELTGRLLKIEKRRAVPLLDRSKRRSSAIVVICSWCKKIKTRKDRWVEIEEALDVHELFGPLPPELTHSLCPECFARILGKLNT